MRLDGVELHSLSFVDACLVGLAQMERAYPDKVKRTVEYKRIAASVGITLEEDPQLALERNREAMAQIEADFGGPTVQGRQRPGE